MDLPTRRRGIAITHAHTVTQVLYIACESDETCVSSHILGFHARDVSYTKLKSLAVRSTPDLCFTPYLLQSRELAPRRRPWQPFSDLTILHPRFGIIQRQTCVAGPRPHDPEKGTQFFEGSKKYVWMAPQAGLAKIFHRCKGLET